MGLRGLPPFENKFSAVNQNFSRPCNHIAEIFFRNSKILHFFGMKSEIDHSDDGYFGEKLSKSSAEINSITECSENFDQN